MRRGLFVVALVSGCGSDHHAAPDGAVIDDAPNDGVPLDAVRITVTRAGAPVIATPVLFHDGTGAVIAQLETDAAGQATMAVTGPAMLTLVLKDTANPEYEIVTWADVANGDDIVFEDRWRWFRPKSDFQVSTPSRTGTSNGISAGECQDVLSPGGPAQTLSLYSSCQAHGTTAILAVGQSPDEFTFAKGLAFGAPGPVALPAWSASTTATIDGGTVLHAGAFDELAGDLAFRQLVTAATGSSSVQIHGAFADAIQTSLYTPITVVAGRRTDWVVTRREPPGATTIALDLSSPLAAPQNVQVDTTTLERPAVTWTDPPATTVGGVVHLDAYVGGARWEWTMFVSPTATSARVPEMPAGSAWVAPAGWTLKLVQVGFFATDLAADYAAVRRHPAVIAPVPTFAPAPDMNSPVLPATGSVQATLVTLLY